MSSVVNGLTRGIIRENPTFRLLLGMCPVLAVTVSATNGFGMGISTMAVLVASNLAISALRNFIPKKIRIPCYILIAATFVTIVDMLLKAFTPDLHAALGIFIPLIVVNCIILGRAEAYAGKNPVFSSIIDGLGFGLGFTLSVTIVGIIREVIGAGTVFGYNIMGAAFEPMGLLATPPGAFIVLGLLLILFNVVYSHFTASSKKRSRTEITQMKGESESISS